MRRLPFPPLHLPCPRPRPHPHLHTHPQRTFRPPKPTRSPHPATPPQSQPPKITRTTSLPNPPRRAQKADITSLLRFKITLAPAGVSRKILELVKRASISKHVIRTLPSISRTLSALPSGRHTDMGPVIFAFSPSALAQQVPVILECNRVGVSWVFVGEEEDVGGGGVMVVPWMVGSGGKRGGEVEVVVDGKVGEGAKAVAREFNFRDARRVVVGLLEGVRDLDAERGGEEGEGTEGEGEASDFS
ncbi:hypothetical protein L873DRAFT_520836 [Choiromyces venosus 120613-1]|uniref:Uncharacterized protein n=1 Tax=Choiromyces venosus 120613-1 TaxID=1336337 RepID=A0A3N4K4X1_9PEZI|nr:hypothetical protein L873DRAFT_520836 [Choiromyces venosus 120613-1]